MKMLLFEPSGNFSSKSLSIRLRLIEPTPRKAEWMIFFLNRVLFEWLRDRYKEQAHSKISFLKEIEDYAVNLLIFHRLIPILSLRTLATSFIRLRRDHAV